MVLTRGVREKRAVSGSAVTDDEAKVYFLNLPEAWLDYPFGPDVCVFKVKNKIFQSNWNQISTPKVIEHFLHLPNE